MQVSQMQLIANVVIIATWFTNFVSINCTSPGITPVVETSNGLIRGSIATSRNGKIYHQFLGIPYASPPIGQLRFESPQAPGNWSGIRDALHFKSECIQFEGMFIGRIKGVEDCLYLNVMTPNLLNPASMNAVPVMVFIHGGGYFSGNPRIYDGKYLVDENVVLVTIAYRLASFGFLSTGDEVIRGNMGLKDQSMALHWIQQNIARFGGDPNRVTLFGESSGAAAVHAHILSPMSKGLFHRAISQTGSTLRKYPNTKDLEGQARNLAKRVGCGENLSSIQEIVDCLKKVDALKIVETHRDVRHTLRGEYSVFGPTVEAVKDENAFLVEEPKILLQTGNYNHVPWITGINSADGIIFANGYVKDRPTANKLDALDGWLTHLPRLLRYDDDNLDKSISTAEKIRQFYFGDGLPSDPKNFQNLTNMFSDRMYFLSNYNVVKLQAPQSPVYLYYFDYKTMGSVFKVVDAVQPHLQVIPAELQIAGHFVKSWINENIFGQERPFYGAAHGDELFLLFSLNILLEARLGTADYDASRAMVKAWTDFAKGKQILYDGVPWPEVGVSDPLQYLRITNNPSIINDPVEERIRFWKSLDLTFLGEPL